MDEGREFLKEDGYLSVQECANIHKIIFHPNLNVILIFTKSNILTLDVNSGVVLQRVSNEDTTNKNIRGKYLTDYDKVLFWNNKNMGLRCDYNGVLLLDTILQTPITNTDNPVKIELLLSEALLLHQSLSSLEQQGVENSADVINELVQKITEAQRRAKKGIKAQKWETICLELPHSSLKVVASTMVMELKSLQRHIPALSIASAVNERLTDLIVGGRVIENDQIQRFHMYSEAARRKTFDSWPHMDYKFALPDQMAQAGFYHQSSESGDDRAMCFTCSVCLVCWEKTDEPWCEHERHSPDCPFLKGEYTQNVPISVTYATSPAVSIGDYNIISSGESSNIVCTANSNSGDICVWNVERQLEKVALFNIKTCEENILKRNDIEDDLNVKLSSLCTYKKNTIFKVKEGAEKTKTCAKGTRIVAGVKCNWTVNNATGGDKDQAFEMNRVKTRKCFLVVYAVTEVPKSATKQNVNTTAANGTLKDSDQAMNNTYTNANVNKNGNSLITILESSYEERLDGFDDCFLKYIDNKDLSAKLGNEYSSNADKNTWSFVPQQPPPTANAVVSQTSEKVNESEMDSAKALPMNGPGSVKFNWHGKQPVKKSENEVICFPIQTLEVSADEKFEIKEILTSCDNRYLLVALKSINREIISDENENCDVCQLVVYEIDDKGLLVETPIVKRLFTKGEVPIEFCMLPKFDTNGRIFSGSPTESNAFVITCDDGSVKVLSITTLKTLSEARVENEKFISSVYCKNLERLCSCTASGSLHFYSFYDLDNDSSDEIEDEVIAEPISSKIDYDTPMPSTSSAATQSSKTTDVKNQQKIKLIAHKKDLSLNDLKTLYSLTLFDEMLTPYSAEVPGCWTELVQAQKQRRHPQNMGPGEDTHLIRTWRLHNDATTWDEHLIELSLPKTTSLGHIDFKFSILQPCSNPPAIQVTLLKQKSIGLCCRRKPGSKQSDTDSSMDVDDNINYNLNSSAPSSSNPLFNSTQIENPVLSEEYLQARNAEILAGPIELSSCMDLNEQGGTVTFVSPKLLKSKARNYLLHIKTMADVAKDGQNKTRGCDWLHEISISIRATREVPNVSNERLQRLAMLESNTLLKNLLEMAENPGNSLIQNLAIDILNWILTIRLARYRCPKSGRNYGSSDYNAQQMFCVNVVENHLTSLINKCIIMNNRSMAHKCVKLIINTLHGAQNMIDQKICLSFENALKNSILSSIPDITKSSHAGALRWFTMLISATSSVESQGPISIAVIKLLIEVLGEISKRPNNLNSILQSRFGLYGMPFESELFDAELPLFGKGNNIAYSNVFLPKSSSGTVPNGVQQQQQQQQLNQFTDLKSFCQSETSELRVPIHLRRKSISNHIKGLLEVEPLHFVCCSTSEATRIENMDSLPMQTNNVIDDIVIETPPHVGIGTSKLVTNEHIIKMPNEKIILESELDKKFDSQYVLAKNVVDKIFYSHMKKHKFKDSSSVNESMLNNLPIFTGDEELMIMQQNNSTPKKSTEKETDDDGANKLGGSSAYSNRVREFIEETNREDIASTVLPWHKLLSVPSKQMIVVDRMHSGARRQVTLDFGYHVLLTDIIIPACNDLASLTIDTWCFEEDNDCVRLAVSQDIGVKALILSDLQPPPVCRFLRITFMGRYGMSATRCKLPMGSFYGHVVILDKDSYADPVMKFIKNKKNYIQTQLKVLNALYEDTHCRYCLANSKLSELLQPLLKSEHSNMSHMQNYLNRLKDSDDCSQEYAKISSVYEECIQFQNQLNVVKNVIRRLESALDDDNLKIKQNTENSLKSLCTDKLRVVSECLVELLLHFIITYGQHSISSLHTFFDLDTCNLMFKTLVINGDSHIRIASCSMLVKMCSYTLKPWWGNFFADTFTSLFSSQNVEVFPQDRVFILLTYLGRKSIQIGTCRTIVIDAILKTIANLLAPMSANHENRLGIWRNTDLTLLSWLLLFLSVCLDDNNERKENSNPRWDFMSGDIVKARLSTSNSSSRSFSRSFKKRFMQNKQGSSNQNIAEKVYMMSEQIANAPAMLSTSTGNLDSVINKAQDLKNHLKKLLPPSETDYLFSKNYLKKSSSDAAPKPSSSIQPSTFVVPPNKNENSDESPFDRGLKSIKTQNMLVVIRGLIGLLLNMDFTCNMDLFLLTCKIIAKLVNACKISIQLSSIMTTQQLLQLVRIAVWENQQHPWAVHAITCLLQDILEADRSYKCSDEGASMDDSSAADGSLAQALAFDPDFLKNLAPASSSTANQSTSSIFKDLFSSDFRTDSSKYQLPSLMEDDTDGIEDILDDILEQSKKLTAATGVTVNKKDTTVPTPTRSAFALLYKSKVSSAMDARLENGLDINTEIFLRRLVMKSSINLIASLPHYENKEATNPEIPPWPESITNAWNNVEYQQKIDTNIMLMDVFETIFTDLHLEDSWLNLEQVLQLWLTLNGDSATSETSSKIVFNNLQSKIPFGEKAVNGLLKALASHPELKIRGWCLGFLCLIYSMSSKGFVAADPNDTASFECSYNKKIGMLILNNENFQKMLLRFFSGIYKNNSIQTGVYAGPTMCRLIQEMFSCLQNKCQLKENLKDILLKVCLSLIQQDGAISKQLGPIDAQNQLIKELLNYQYQKSDLSIAMSIIECVSSLVYHYITNVDKIQCQKSSDTNSNSNNVFGSLFATVLGSESAQSKTVTDSTILINLLKLSSILIRTKLPPIVLNEEATNESQTDEIKAEQQQQNPNQNPRASPPTFTDTVLQNFPTMNKFLGALSHCNASSAALLVICSIYSPMYNESKNTFSDPMSVEDALFQLIIYMNKLASEPVLVIKPLFDYINYVSNIRHAMPKIYLSEPFLWFILKILETPAALEVFCEMGGIKILAENLVKSNRTLLNMQPNLVTMIMQHLSKTQNLQSIVNVATAKKTTGSNSKYEEGLINFAPYCTISSENPSAQSADVLIQGQVASHRRARAAAWSYLFYPNESHVDLILTLPTAVLLKEIQLQPHLSTLASCPSAVAIEISRDGMCNPIPITQPIPTVGMTCIRLKFSQPEIATHIIIRLYRPKDSASIGLTQISLLGTTIFSDTTARSSSTMSTTNNDFYGSEDENQSETSFGWLRILAQCFNVATFNSDNNLSNIVISSASEINGFMEACCSLLSIAPSMSNYLLQNLETVLLKLGLHCRELSLKLINILLNESIPHFFKICNETVSDILYQLCTTSDSFARDRIQMILEWLINLEKNNQLKNVNPNSGYIKCLASILWQAYATNLVLDLGNLITIELFETLYGWLQTIPTSSPMKLSIDSMICSICCIRPEYFNLLLRKMNVLVPNHSLSDDRKDNESMTDDNKQHENDTEEWYCHYSIQNLSTLTLTSSELQTIAMACQSPLAICQLIDSGLPNLFTSAILEFCHRTHSEHSEMQPHSSKSMTDNDKLNYPMISVRKIKEILEFFAEICSEGHMRDWLGSYEGSVFWEPLLTLLCNNKLQSSYINNDDINNQQYLELEEIVIKFLSNVTACHPKNQDTLTTNLISVIRTTEKNNYNNLHQNAPGTSSSKVCTSALNMKYSISGFTRRLVLQILLESEKIVVSVRSELPLLRKYDSSMTYISNHPSKKPNSHHLLFYVSINTKCHEIMENSISVLTNLLPSLNNSENNSTRGNFNSSDFPLDTRSEKKDLWDLGMQMNFGMEFLSVAAGVTAKDKRSKELKNQENAQRTKEFFNVFKMKPDDMKGSLGSLPDSIQLVHSACPEVILTSDTTIAQVLTMLKSSGISLSTPCINLNLVQVKGTNENEANEIIKASDFNPLPSPLQIFSTRGGLSLLAHYLPTVYPEQPKTSQKLDKDKNFQGEWVKGEWIKIEPNEEIYEDVDDALLEPSSKSSNVISSVPQHSLAAFGLFLKLPAYSEVLLRDKVRAQCLLRLILGVTGDGEGNDIYSLALSSSLPTLPFEVLRQLLDSSPITTDDGVLLRRMIIEVGAIHLVLNCLSIFTHQSSNIAPGPEMAKAANTKSSSSEDHIVSSDDKSHVYWAKGTGFGTGSTQQSWNVEQALLKQKSEEEHVTVLLQVLSSYINPGDIIPNAESSDTTTINYSEACDLPPLFLDLLQQSCLIPALCSYLRNDSVLDITRHIPLYRAILQLLRALSISSQLVQLLVLKQENDTKTSIANLLYNMKSCVDTYASRLKINKKSNLKGQSQKISINLDESDDEGLALLIPDIQETTALVQSATFEETNTKDDHLPSSSSIEYPIASSVEQKYLEVMKKLQFDTFDMIVESENGYRFTISHHFESNVRMAGGDRGHPARVKRLAQEAVTLSTSLPLSYSSSVFVRCDTDRLDIMKVLITGPSDTPYANGCFEFDVYFPHDYPNSPMMINLETTGRHSVRFNPNLYNDGKVCLSVLNTWHGRPEEKWNAQTSSFLQVLVSIQSLILVSEPYFNEPGFERSRGTPSGNHSSREYNSNIYQACVKWAMLEQIKNPSPCFKDVINAHFWLKRNEICQQVENWITELSRPQISERSGRAISFNSMVLRRQYRQLREELAKLPVPEGLENFDNPFSVNPLPSSSNSNTALAVLPSPSSSIGGISTSTTSTIGKLEDKTLLEILNSIDDEKKDYEMISMMLNETNGSEDPEKESVDELLTFSSPLDLQDTIAKMISDDMGE